MTEPVACDYCDGAFDHDDEPVPVRFGPPPSTGFFESSDTLDASRLSGDFDLMLKMDDGPRFDGTTLPELMALHRAVGAADWAECESSPRVEVVQELGGGAHWTEDPGEPPAPVGTEVDEGVAAATLRVCPEPDWPDPDMWVHDYCEEAIRGD